MYNILATDSQSAFHVTTPQTHKINYLSSKSASTHNYWTSKHLHLPIAQHIYRAMHTIYYYFYYCYSCSSCSRCLVAQFRSQIRCQCVPILLYLILFQSMRLRKWNFVFGSSELEFLPHVLRHTHDDLWPLIATYLLIFGLLWPYDCCYIFWLFRAASQNSHLVNRVLFVVHNHSFVFFFSFFLILVLLTMWSVLVVVSLLLFCSYFLLVFSRNDSFYFGL